MYPAMIQYVPYNLAWYDLDHGTGQGLLICMYVTLINWYHPAGVRALGILPSYLSTSRPITLSKLTITLQLHGKDISCHENETCYNK